MSIDTLFDLAALETISKDIIAVLLYDIGKSDIEGIEREAIEGIFHESITEASRNILSSEKTKLKLLDKLQNVQVGSEIERVRLQGNPLPTDYFVNQFSGVISEKNAKKIAPRFLENFRKKIASDRELSRQIMVTYVDLLQQVEWDLQGELLDQFKFLLDGIQHPPDKERLPDQANGKKVDRSPKIEDTETKKAQQKIESASAQKIEATERYHELIKNLALHTERSGDLSPWDQTDCVYQVRGLRKLESFLSRQHLLYITGSAGAGKSLLISAYLHNHITNGSVKPNDIFYYRFIKCFTDYHSFIKSLLSFLEKDFVQREDDKVNDDLATFIVESDAFFIFDDLQYLEDQRLLQLLEHIWQHAGQAEAFKGSIILINRDTVDGIKPAEKNHFSFQGLSLAESNELLRDIWQLQFPNKRLARAVAEKLHGHPLLMRLFKNWWESEPHADTQLERFAQKLPDSIHRMRDYLCQTLYDTLERTRSRVNSLLIAMSIFRLPETEYRIGKLYEYLGGNDFQIYLEKLVETHRLVSFHQQINRYDLHQFLRDFYIEQISRLNIHRIIHHYTGELYLERADQSSAVLNAIEAAYHFCQANHHERAARVLQPFFSSAYENTLQAQRFLKIFKELHFDTIEDDQLKTLALYNRGRLYWQLGFLDEAERDLSACDQLQSSEDLQASIYYYLGLVNLSRQENDIAIEYLHTSLSIFEIIGDKNGIACSSENLGTLYWEKGERDLAIRYFERAFKNYAKINQLEKSVLLGEHLIEIGKEEIDSERIQEYYKMLVEVYKKSGDLSRLVSVLDKVGKFYLQRQEWDQAIENYNREKEAREKMNDWKGFGKACQQLGNIYLKKEDWENAIAQYQKSLDLFEKNSDNGNLASLYNNLGFVYQSRQEWDLARGFYQKAREIYEKIDDLSGLADSFNHIGQVFTAQQKWDQALEAFEKSLAVKEETTDVQGTAEIYQEMGTAYQSSGEQVQAKAMYEKAVEILLELNDLPQLAQTYFKMGNIYRDNGDPENAVASYQKSLDYATEIGNTLYQAKSHYALGVVSQELYEWENALDYYQRAIIAYHNVSDTPGLAKSYYRMGTVYHDLGEWNQAFEYYQKSLPLFEKTGDLYNTAQTLGNISSIEFEQHRYQEAIYKQVEILLYFQERNKQELVDHTLGNLTACHQELGEDAFQPILENSLQVVSQKGVLWGKHNVVPADKAAKLVSRIFYNE